MGPIKFLAIATAMIAFISVTAPPASAQRSRGGGHKATPEQGQRTDDQKKKSLELEKAAKAALDRLPNKKFDPWGSAR